MVYQQLYKSQIRKLQMFEGSTWGRKQKNLTSELDKISGSVSEIKESQSPRFLENMHKVLTFFFGKYQSVGILSRFTKDFVNYRPLEWAVQLQKILNLIGPNSLVFRKITQNKDTRLVLMNSYLPPHVDPSLLENSTPRSLGLKKTYQGFSVSLFDAYLLMLIRAIYDSEHLNPEISQFQNLTLDETFASLSRNSLLVLLRKVLDYCSDKKQQLTKLISIFRMYMMDQILHKYDQDKFKQYNNQINFRSRSTVQDFSSFSNKYNENPLQQKKIRYKLKSHHLLSLMLLIKYTQNLPTNTFELGKYFQAVSENFKHLNPDKQSFHTLMRAWMHYVISKNHNNVQNQVINVLEKANVVDGWFYLKRYRPQQITTNQNFNLTNIKIAHIFLKQLNHDSFWSPQTIYVFTLSCFFNLLASSNVFFTELENEKRITHNREAQNNDVKYLKKIYQRIDNNLNNIFGLIKKTNPQELDDCRQAIEDQLSIMESYLSLLSTANNKNYNSRLPKSLDLSGQFQFRKIDISAIKPQNSFKQSNQIISGEPNFQMSSIESKRRLITFYRRQERGCWQIPIQYNQSVFLYYFFFIIAKTVDFFIPGNRSSPKLNLRFLANPLTFSGLFIIFVLLYLFLWK